MICPLRWLAWLSILGVLACGVRPVGASYPERPVHIVVGFAPGGGTDSLARFLGQKLSEKWGQPVLIENREGADGTIAENMVAHARPDGYTLALVPNPHTISSAHMQLAYDPIKSFAPITLLVKAPDLLVVNPSILQIGSVKELVALAKAKPGQLNFGSPGTSSINFLEMAVFAKRLGIDLVNVSYKGGMPPAIIDLLSGGIHTMFASVAAVGPQIQAGKLRALAVGGNFRIPSMPEVPTVAEAADLPGYDVTVWDGVLAPAATPRDIIVKLHDDMVEAMKVPDFQKFMSGHGFFPVGNSPEEFDAFIREDVERWATLMKALDIRG